MCKKILLLVTGVWLSVNGSVLAIDHWWHGGVSADVNDPANWTDRNAATAPTTPGGDTVRIGASWGSEDLNANGVLDPGEDLNGNGVIDDPVPPNVIGYGGYYGTYGTPAAAGGGVALAVNPVLSTTYVGRTGTSQGGWWFVVNAPNILTLKDGAFLIMNKKDCNLRNGGRIEVQGRSSTDGPSLVVAKQFRIAENGAIAEAAKETSQLRICGTGWMQVDPALAGTGVAFYIGTSDAPGTRPRGEIIIENQGRLELLAGTTALYLDFGNVDPSVNQIIIRDKGELWLMGDPNTMGRVGATDTVTSLQTMIAMGLIANDQGRPLMVSGTNPTVVSIVPPTAVMVVNATDLSLGFDQAMHDHLVALGYDVTAVLGNDVKNGIFTKADANSYDLVLVSESISSSASDKLIGTTTPVMHNESYGWDNWFFTTPTKMAWTVGSDVNMVTDAHPIAAMAGLHTGSMAFFSTTAQWTTELASAMAPGAKLLAKTTVDGNDLAIVFVFEKGAKLANGTAAPARAAGFSIPADKHYDPNAMTDKAWALFDATIQWLNPEPRKVQVAKELFVDVNAADPTAGTATWDNKGTLGDFSLVTAANMPAGSKVTGAGALGVNVILEQFDGVPVVKVNSASATVAAYVGPKSVPGIEADGDRSVEAWVEDDVLPQAQNIICWGRRGGNPNGSNVAFGYGTRPNFGAVGHYGDPYDCGWGTNLNAAKTVMANQLPAAGILHHLVYTYEGTAVKLYRDGQLVVTRPVGEYPIGTGTPDTLHTAAGQTINLFVENNDATGALANSNLPDGLRVNSIRVHDGVLTDAQVLNNYLVGPAK